MLAPTIGTKLKWKIIYVFIVFVQTKLFVASPN